MTAPGKTDHFVIISDFVFAGASARHGPKNLRIEPKLVCWLAKIPYCIVACLLRSPDFVTLAALRPILNKLVYDKVVGLLGSGHIY